MIDSTTPHLLNSLVFVLLLFWLPLWEGEFEGQPGLWLRWCDETVQVIPTGAERAALEEQRANQERQRTNEAETLLEQERRERDQLLERLRTMGINPDKL